MEKYFPDDFYTPSWLPEYMWNRYLLDLPDHPKHVPEYLRYLPDHPKYLPEYLRYLPDHPKYLPEYFRYLPDYPKYLPEFPKYLPEYARYLPESLKDYPFYWLDYPFYWKDYPHHLRDDLYLSDYPYSLKNYPYYLKDYSSSARKPLHEAVKPLKPSRPMTMWMREGRVNGWTAARSWIKSQGICDKEWEAGKLALDLVTDYFQRSRTKGFNAVQLRRRQDFPYGVDAKPVVF